jgi:hypothetical protein
MNVLSFGCRVKQGPREMEKGLDTLQRSGRSSKRRNGDSASCETEPPHGKPERIRDGCQDFGKLHTSAWLRAEIDKFSEENIVLLGGKAVHFVATTCDDNRLSGTEAASFE